MTFTCGLWMVPGIKYMFSKSTVTKILIRALHVGLLVSIIWKLSKVHISRRQMSSNLANVCLIQYICLSLSNLWWESESYTVVSGDYRLARTDNAGWIGTYLTLCIPEPNFSKDFSYFIPSLLFFTSTAEPIGIFGLSLFY